MFYFILLSFSKHYKSDLTSKVKTNTKRKKNVHKQDDKQKVVFNRDLFFMSVHSLRAIYTM